MAVIESDTLTVTDKSSLWLSVITMLSDTLTCGSLSTTLRASDTVTDSLLFVPNGVRV